jgi:hypothetical protein
MQVSANNQIGYIPPSHARAYGARARTSKQSMNILFDVSEGSGAGGKITRQDLPIQTYKIVASGQGGPSRKDHSIGASGGAYARSSSGLVLGPTMQSAQKSLKTSGVLAAKTAYEKGQPELANVMGGPGLHESSSMAKQQREALGMPYVKTFATNAADAAAAGNVYDLNNSGVNGDPLKQLYDKYASFSDYLNSPDFKPEEATGLEYRFQTTNKGAVPVGGWKSSFVSGVGITNYGTLVVNSNYVTQWERPVSLG